jgi:membrane protease YdiL (CAAX protease family)
VTVTPPGAPDTGSAPEPIVRPAVPPAQRSPIHPYVRVALFLVGYLFVAVLVSVAVVAAGGILDALGVVTLPTIDEELLAAGTDGIMEWLSDFMLPIVVVMGLYSIAYTWAFVRLIDGRRLRTLGLERRAGWFGQFGKGAGLAFVILLGIFLFSLATGSIELRGFARPAPDTSSVAGYLVGALIAFLLVGFYEEVMFRGYVLQVLNERAGRAASVVVSSVIFALMHGANPGADITAIVNVIAIGVLLSFLYFRTRSLWMPIGFHFGWNFLLGYVFTLPVSGLPMRGILDVVEATGPGGAPGRYGPESSIATTLALGLWAAWLLVRRARRRAYPE